MDKLDVNIHDCTLIDISFSWKTAKLTIKVLDNLGEKFLLFNEVNQLNLSRKFPWGESVSINGLEKDGEGNFRLEMQSGDNIVISAKSFSMNHKTIVSDCGKQKIEILQDGKSYVFNKYVKKYDDEEKVFYETRELPDPNGRYSDIDTAVEEAMRLVGVLKES